MTNDTDKEAENQFHVATGGSVPTAIAIAKYNFAKTLHSTRQSTMTVTTSREGLGDADDYHNLTLLSDVCYLV